MSWFQEAKNFHAQNPDLTDNEVAAKFNRAGKTYQNRRYEEKRHKKYIGDHHEKNIQVTSDSYTLYSDDHSVEITKDKLRELKELYCDQQFTIKQVCRKMKITKQDFNLIKNTFDITHDDTPFIDEDFQKYTIEELVEQRLQRRKHRYFLKLQEKELSQALKELDEYRNKEYFHNKTLNSIIKELKATDFNKDILPYNPLSSQKNKKKATNKTLVLNLADLHKGKLIMGNQMPTGNHHDKDIFLKKMEKIISTVENLLANNDYDYFYIFNYGDSLDDPDALTYNKQVLHQYESGENQIVSLLHIMKKMIVRFLKYTNVHYIGVPGNHSKNITNWDVLLNQLLEFIFEDYEGITFDCTNKTSKVVTIYDSDIVITHGNHLNNSKTKGEIDTLNIFRMYGLSSKKTYLFQGHLHHYESTKYRRVYLPSIVGGDDLAENMMNITSRPAQLLCTFSEEGLIQENHIYLD